MNTLNKLLKLLIWQKKALRIIKNTRGRQHCRPIFKEYKIMTVVSMYIFSALVNVKENFEIYQLREDVHSYNTRNRYMLEIPQVRLQKTQGSHHYMNITLFNKLPKECWYLEIKKFKLVFKNWLKENPFYKVDEYMTCDTDTLKNSTFL